VINCPLAGGRINPLAMTREDISTHRDRLALWVLPLLFTLALVAARQASLPFWQAFNLDPDYYYLLNGLRMVEGLAPTDVSHPGTPVQLLIALVLKAMHLGAAPGAIVDAVLDDPEGHLYAATTVVYLLVGASLWLMGRAVFAWGGLAPALLAQAAPFLARIIVKMALHPKPEPFLIVAVAGLAAASFAAARAERAGDRHALWAGVAMGFGIACKIHFVALGVVPLLLFDRRRFLLYAAATMLSFAAFFAPALPSLDIWLDWLHRVVLGAGAYGEGARTVIDPGRYPRAVWRLFSAKWFYTGGMVLSLAMLAAYFRLRRRGLVAPDRSARLLAGIVLGQFATQLLIAKHPAPHYMVPALMLTGPALAVLWRMSATILPPVGHRRAWAGLALAAVVAGGIGTVRQIQELAGWTRDTQALPMARFAGCAKVYFDAASAPSYAFLRGDMNAQARYSPLLAKRFPADEFTWFTNDHTWWSHRLVQWGRPVAMADILAGHPCTVFRGNQYSLFESLMAGTAFDDKCAVGEEMLYTKGVTCDGRAIRPIAK